MARSWGEWSGRPAKPLWPLRLMRNWFRSVKAPLTPPRDLFDRVIPGAVMRAAMCLSLLQRHIARLPDVICDCDECSQIYDRCKRQRGVNQQWRSRLVAQSYRQRDRREHYRRYQLSIDYTLPQNEDRDESQNSHQ